MHSGAKWIVPSCFPAFILIVLLAQSHTCLGTPLEIESFGPSRAVARVGDEILFRGAVKNFGDEPVRSIEATLLLDGNSIGDPKTAAQLDPEKTAGFEWSYTVEHEMSAVAEMVVQAENAASTSSISYVAALSDRPAPADVVIDGENVKLVFTCTVHGYGPASLFVLSGNDWTEVARLMSFSRIAYKSQDGKVHRRLVCAEIADNRRRSALFAKDLVDADGDVWHFMFRFSAGDDGKSILAEYTLRTENDEELLAFGGPILYVGDGTTGEEKDAALFPGLEYLESDEASSSVLDVGPPHNVRRVPHPNKITIPLMEVNVRRHLVGLVWEPLQKWDGTNDRPSALFASPNSFESMSCHVMGLFLPSCPRWVAENATEAAQAYRLRAGQEVKLAARIFSKYPAESSIEAVERWIDKNGVPDPLEPPRGTLEEELDFSLTAYTDTLWVEQEGKWRDTLGVNQREPEYYPTFVHQLLLGARRTKNEERREQYRARTVEALRGMPVDKLGLDLAFASRGLEKALAVETAHAVEIIESQRRDGSWTLEPNSSEASDSNAIGELGVVELGTCANPAYDVLKFARISANSDALDAGLKALDYMRRFNVPRGTQGREAPSSHAPDVLASAHAVLAYLEGYNLAGDRAYLDEAVRWARAGLPFIYMWNSPDMPYMRYASIPAFGATQRTDSSFGRPAQRTGLDYAYALLRLSEHDRTLPCRKIATGVTISAMYQQQDDGERAALYPDSQDLVDGSRASSWLNPSGVLRNVLTLIGEDPDTRTVIVRQDADEVHISSGAVLENARYWRRGITFDLVLPRGETSSCVAIPAVQPDKVTANRARLQQVMDLDMADEGWRYDERHRALFIKILHRQERMRVVVRSASR